MRMKIRKAENPEAQCPTLIKIYKEPPMGLQLVRTGVTEPNLYIPRPNGALVRWC